MKAGCKPNGIILDPFCGSGTTAISALKNGCKFIGIEQETEFLDLTIKRLEKLKREGK